MKRRLWGVLSLGMALLPLAQCHPQIAVEQAIATRFPLTKPTADHSDVVTAGAVMVLKKDGLVMIATTANGKAQETYKDGKIQLSTLTRMLVFGGVFGHASSGIAHRSFVTGEKLWLIDVQKENDGVVLQLLSDAINDVRYTAFLHFPYNKGQTPSSEEIIGQIQQVMDKQADQEAAPPAKVAGPPAPSPPPLPEIPPPPPPPDQAEVPPPSSAQAAAVPTTLEKGLTKDQVVAMLGEPLHKTKIGSKEIYLYKDLKITFIDNKVSKVD